MAPATTQTRGARQEASLEQQRKRTPGALLRNGRRRHACSRVLDSMFSELQQRRWDLQSQDHHSIWWCVIQKCKLQDFILLLFAEQQMNEHLLEGEFHFEFQQTTLGLKPHRKEDGENSFQCETLSVCLSLQSFSKGALSQILSD